MKTQLIQIGLVMWSIMFCPYRIDAQEGQFNFATGQVQGRYHVGGLIGRAGEPSGVLSNNYALSGVVGQQNVGGLIGSNAGLITDCYAAGAVSGNSLTGGFTGKNTGLVADSYWDMQRSGQSTSSGGSGRSTDEMTYPYAANTFVNWNFETVWKQDALPWANQGYPYFQPTEVYRLDLKVYPGGAGIVTGAGYYKANTEVSIEAVPNQEFEFVGWMLDGNVITTQEEYTYSLPSHKSLTAVFQKISTSVDENTAERVSPVRIYPNPANDELNVEILTLAEEVRTVFIVNTLGQTVRAGKADDTGQVIHTFYIRNLTPGLYGVVIDYGNKKIMEKVIIQ